MDLTTRCPQCGSVFTATLEQLQLRKGYIRCVSCAHIFDGYDAVVPGGEAVAAVPAAIPPVAAPVAPAPVATTSIPSVLRQRQGKKEPGFETGSTPEPQRQPPSDMARPAFSISATRQISQESSRQDPVFRSGETGSEGTDPVVVRGRRPEPVLGRERDIIPPSPEPLIAKSRQAAPQSSSGMHHTVPNVYVEPRGPAATADHPHAPDLPGPEAPRYRGIASVFWGGLIVAGLVLLLAQLAYVYRAQLAQQVPVLRPLLTQACVQLKCEVSYSRKINQISIMSSSLKAAAGAAATAAAPAGVAKAADAGDAMTLQVTLRNTYDKPQEWPTLVLDLTDFSGTLVVRKNLLPSSYLTPDALRQPFAASSEMTVGVPIVLNGVKVNGYQLGKFFP